MATRPVPVSVQMDQLPVRMQHSTLIPVRPRLRAASPASSTSSPGSAGTKTATPSSKSSASILSELQSCFERMDSIYLARFGSTSAARGG